MIFLFRISKKGVKRTNEREYQFRIVEGVLYRVLIFVDGETWKNGKRILRKGENKT